MVVSEGSTDSSLVVATILSYLLYHSYKKPSGAATDNSPMKMEVKNDRLDGDNKVKFVSKYNRYAASFNNGTIARSKLDAGYYYIPYTTSSDFAKKLADGYSYELVFCTYYDPLTYTNGLDAEDKAIYNGDGVAQFNISRGFHLPGR